MLNISGDGGPAPRREERFEVSVVMWVVSWVWKTFSWGSSGGGVSSLSSFFEAKVLIDDEEGILFKVGVSWRYVCVDDLWILTILTD